MRTLVALFARKEIEVDSMNDDGNTAISMACSRGNEAVVRLLVAHKDISLNVRDQYGYLPIRKTVTFRHASIVELLLGLHAARGDLHMSDHDDCLQLYWTSRRIVAILLNSRVEFRF